MEAAVEPPVPRPRSFVGATNSPVHTPSTSGRKTKKGAAADEQAILQRTLYEGKLQLLKGDLQHQQRLQEMDIQHKRELHNLDMEHKRELHQLALQRATELNKSL